MNIINKSLFCFVSVAY